MTTPDTDNPALSSQPTRIVFLGFLGTETELEAAFTRETTPQRSAINFQRALLRALGDAGAGIYVIGTLPVAAYPRNRAFLKGSSRPDGETMPLLNLPGLRMVWRALTSFVRVLAAAGKADVILVYSLHTPLLAAAVAVARIRGVRLGVVIPDLPLHMNSGHSSRLRSLLKSLDDRLLKGLAGRADVVFPITARIATEWLGGSSKYLVVEGVSPSCMQPFEMPPTAPRTSLLYAGNFSHIIKCVQMFSRSSVDAELVLIGGGPERAALENLAQQDERIVVRPFMTPDQLQPEIGQASFLINLRDTTWPGGKYSFPSKLVEYIRQGKPVISTRLDGIPEEYFDYFSLLDDTDDERFARSLAQALAAEAKELDAAVSSAQAMLRERKSSPVVGRRMLEALLRD